MHEIPDPLWDKGSEELGLVHGVQVYDELWKCFEVRDMHEYARKLLVKTARECRNAGDEVGYIKQE